MLQVANRPTPQHSQPAILPPIILKNGTPKKLRIILNDLYYPVPRFFNQKILKSQHLSEILEYIDSWPALDAFYLNVQKNLQNLIISVPRQLSVISFPNLQQLYLENMKLDNFQFLIFTDCPNLKIAYLKGNNVRSLKSLAKSNWKKLQKIEINDGLNVVEIGFLERMSMKANGRVVNPFTNRFQKMEKDKNQKNIDDSLLSIWPKIEGKGSIHLLERRNNMFKKRI